MTEPSEMVKRVARAIWDARERSFPARVRRAPDNLDDHTGAWQSVVAEAQAAIEAMREPTDSMVRTANRLNHHRDRDVWITMIDAALAPAPAQER